MVGMSSTSSTWYDCPGPVAHGAPVRIVLDTTCYSSHRPRPLYRNVGFEKTRKCVFLSPDIVTASNVTVAKTCLTVISPPSLKRMRIYHFLKRIQAQCPHRGGAMAPMGKCPGGGDWISQSSVLTKSHLFVGHYMIYLQLKCGHS